MIVKLSTEPGKKETNHEPEQRSVETSHHTGRVYSTDVGDAQ